MTPLPSYTPTLTIATIGCMGEDEEILGNTDLIRIEVNSQVTTARTRTKCRPGTETELHLIGS